MGGKTNYDNFLIWEKKLESRTKTKIDSLGKFLLDKFMKEDFVYESEEDIEKMIDGAIDYGFKNITKIISFIMLAYYNGDEKFLKSIIKH